MKRIERYDPLFNAMDCIIPCVSKCNQADMKIRKAGLGDWSINIVTLVDALENAQS